MLIKYSGNIEDIRKQFIKDTVKDKSNKKCDFCFLIYTCVIFNALSNGFNK